MKYINSIILVFLLIINFSNIFANINDSSKIIYLIGENHSEKEDKIFKMNVLLQAAQKELIFLSESAARDAFQEQEWINYQADVFPGLTKSYFYGVEDPSLSLFSPLLIGNNQLRFLKQTAEFHGLSQEFASSPYATKVADSKLQIMSDLTRRHNQKLLNKFWQNEKLKNNPIFQYLKSNKKSLINKTLKDQANTLSRKISVGSDLEWIQFTQEAALTLLEDLRKVITHEKLGTLEFLINCFDIYDIESDCNGYPLKTEGLVFQDSLNLILRDDFIIKNIEKIYYLTEYMGKPLVSILGKAHIPEVKKSLIAKGFTVLDKEDLNKVLKRLTEKNDL